MNLVPLYYDKGRNHSIVAGPAEGRQQPGSRSYRGGNELLARIADLTAILASRKRETRKRRASRKPTTKSRARASSLTRRASSRRRNLQLTGKEKEVLDEAGSIRRKTRGNNGAKRDIHDMRSAGWNTRTFIRMIHPSTSSRHIRWKR